MGTYLPAEGRSCRPVGTRAVDRAPAKASERPAAFQNLRWVVRLSAAGHCDGLAEPVKGRAGHRGAVGRRPTLSNDHRLARRDPIRLPVSPRRVLECWSITL